MTRRAPESSDGPESVPDGWSDSAHETLFLPHGRAAAPDSGGSTSLPPDLRRQVTRRLRGIALTYSGAFFCADFLPNFLSGHPEALFSRLQAWLPGTASILLGIAVAMVAGNPRLRWEQRMNLGLAFEVVGSYGIAIAQYAWLPHDIPPEVFHVLSPSWVAIWMIFYSIVVPAPPARTALAALASASAAPVVIAVTLQRAGLLHTLTPLHFFLMHVLPYLICFGMTVIGARVLYRLGKDVTRARELGSYRLTERLGQGGMGEVWKATHHLLARPAAIKFIRADAIAGSNPEAARVVLRRFEREARVTASLTSPHTIGLYDFGVTEDGTFYYVMELLDGVDLDQLVRRFGPVAPARVVHFLLEACESLEEAHAKGLIHRDVKPANLYACRSGLRYDFVKVLDFGLVARADSARSADTRLTMPDHAAGTPAYMPPEVARGGEVDGRADLYALGCVAYWLATATPVFAGKGAYDIVSQHLSATPEPPTQRGADLPPPLEALILRCLAKDPNERPADAGELARLLRAIPLHESWGPDEAALWWATHLPATAAS